MRFPSSALFGSLSALCLAQARREGHGMTSPATIHDDWFKLGLAITAFAVSMLFASLLMPADDVATATVASDVLGP
jgi:hypothetical protein